MLAKLINLNDAQIIVLPNGQVAYPQFQPESDSDDEFEMEQDSDDEVPQFVNGLQSLMVIKAADFDKLQADITDTTLHRTQDPSKIGKKNAKRCAELEKTAYTNPKFVEKSKKGVAFRMKVQLEIEELKCYAHMGL